MGHFYDYLCDFLLVTSVTPVRWLMWLQLNYDVLQHRSPCSCAIGHHSDECHPVSCTRTIGRFIVRLFKWRGRALNANEFCQMSCQCCEQLVFTTTRYLPGPSQRDNNDLGPLFTRTVLKGQQQLMPVIYQASLRRTDDLGPLFTRPVSGGQATT